MFNMYRRRFYPRSRLHGHGSEEELGHDRFNYMNPTVNYDKWPRRLRPKKNSLKVELEAPESPHLHEQADGIGPAGSAHFPSSSTHAGLHQRHCHGSLREHQRLLNLRSSRHKCSPRCRVKVTKRKKSKKLFTPPSLYCPPLIFRTELLHRPPHRMLNLLLLGGIRFGGDARCTATEPELLNCF